VFTLFAASIIFPRFLALHQLFGLFLPRRLYHRTHISCMRADWFERLVHQGYFTIFVLSVSSKSVPICECLNQISLWCYSVLIFFLVVNDKTTVNNILITLQQCGLFHSNDSDIKCCLYTAATRF
jgi:hypothetical protein